MAEKEIQHEIIKYLKTIPDLICWRNNVGGRGGGKIRFGEPGAPDIFILMPKYSQKGKQVAIFAGIEVKDTAGRVSDSQHAWEEKYIRYGVKYCVARSVQDAINFIKEVREL